MGEMSFVVEAVVEGDMTDANIRRQSMRLNLSLARSRRQNGRCEFSTSAARQRWCISPLILRRPHGDDSASGESLACA